MQLFLGVHHNRPMPGDRLLQWLTGDQEKTNSIVASSDRDFITTLEEHE